MGARLRRSAPSSAIALAAVGVISWLGLVGFAWSDYDSEAAPAYLALVHGHLTRFLQLLPAYGGSLELRAPFALLPGLFGGGELAVYRSVALPCLLSGAVLGVWLAQRMRADGHTRLARGVALGLCVANPITVQALVIGHPEELLGGVLCVAAVLLATRERPVWAGVLLGLAIANKQWALLAAGPVLLALPRGTTAGHQPHLRAVLVAGAVAVAFLLPMLGARAGGPSTAAAVVTQTGALFQPEQAFWFAGRSDRVVRTTAGTVKLGYRTPPSWLAGVAHPLIVALVLPLTLLCLRRPRSATGGAMLLLALLFLLRCVLDPWDTVYYPLPFIIALVVWEATTRRGPPVLSLAATVAVWTIFVWLPGRASPDLTAAAAMAVAVPAAVGLATALYGHRSPARRAAGRRALKPLSRRSPAPW